MNDVASISEYRCGWIPWGWSYSKVCVQRRVPFLHFWKRWETVWHYKGRVTIFDELEGATPERLLAYYTEAVGEYETWCKAWRAAKEFA